LLYAADLAFRLRWEIRPALAEGRIVIAAHYVETAIAFGQAAGLDARWLDDILSFAPRPHATHYVVARPAKRRHERRGFVEFGCERVAPPPSGFERRALMERARKHLASAARRHSPVKAPAGA
jgi:thymidylate kinase